MKYRLLPVQVENLKQQYDESLIKLKNFNVMKNEDTIENSNQVQELRIGLDTSLLGALKLASENYKDAKEKLANYEIIIPNNSDIIGLGSTFEVEFNFSGETEKDVFTLIEVYNANDDGNFITMASPLGKAVNGLKVGDKANYIVDNIKFEVTVVDIIKDYQKTL